MKEYRFLVNGDKFSWENNSIKIEYSKPSIQAYNEYKIIKNEQGIMYFYYTLKIYKKQVIDYNDIIDKDITDWKLYAEIFVGDFPRIYELKNIIERFIDNDVILEDGQKMKTTDDEIYYHHSYGTGEYFFEDIYEISRDVRKDGKHLTFNIFIGCAASSMGASESVGVRAFNLNLDDLKELYNCVNGFITYAIEQENISIIKEIDENIQKRKIVNNKLYDYLKNKKGLEHIIIEGDCLDITFIDDNNDVIKLNGYTINKITNDKIYFNNGKCVMSDKILGVFVIPERKKLFYGIDEITNDFLNILNDVERNEFIEKSSNYLFKKYSEAIINRTWMCRDEHDLPVVDESNHKNNAKHAVKIVINKIKEKLTQS